MTIAAETGSSPVDYLQTVDSPTVSNAIEQLKLRPRTEGFTPVGIRCIFPEFGRMVGYAVTAHVETMTQDRMDWNKFIDLYAAVDQSPKPAVVVLQEIGPFPDYAAHCGEVMATVFTRLGAIGLVSDCAVRDIPEVRAMKFRYFARGMVASHGCFRIVRVGIPVQIHGLTIHPGDLLHGDENGLISVPHEALPGLPAAVEEVRSREKSLMDFVRGPDFTFEGLKGRILE